MVSRAVEPDNRTEASKATAMTYKIWRVGVLSGVVYMAVGILCWAVIAKFLPAPHQSWNADQIKNYFVEDEHRIRAGLIGYIFIGPLYVPFSLVVARIIRRIEGPEGILNQIEFFGGIGTALITQLSGVVWLVASFRTESRTAQEILLLSDLGWFVFDMTFMLTFLQFCSFGVALLLDKRLTPYFPTWLSWVSFAAAATFMPLVIMPFVTSGPFAWNGLFNYWIALGAFFVWITLVVYYAWRAIATIERETVD